MSPRWAWVGLTILTVVFVTTLYFFGFERGGGVEAPRYDFLYSESGGSPERYELNAAGEVIVFDTDESYSPPSFESPVLYRYDVEADSSTEISLEEANSLPLLAGPAAPDGYVFEGYYLPAAPFFQEPKENVLVKDNQVIQTSIGADEEPFRYSLPVFVAWIDN